jgi:hypothetical protein
MAPIKQEEHMKDKLEKRSLQPSPESWATLANRLDAEEKNKNKSLFWWIGIAASIVGILFLTTMYFNNQPIENDTQIMVDTKGDVNQETQQKGENQMTQVPTKSNELVADHTKVEKKFLNESVSKSNVNTIIEKIPQVEAIAQSEGKKSQKTAASSLSTPIKTGPVEKLTDISNAKLSFENQKVQDVVAQIKTMNLNGSNVSDTEIDSLLKKAQKEILSNRLYNENTRTVDASALLQDVEAGLEQSFRSKVFEALQSSYESVKTAVAQRNN